LICASVVFLLNLGLLRREKVQSEKVSENIIGNLPEIACIFDDAGNFRQWNSSCEGLRGYTASAEQYRSLVASVPDAVWKVDREGSLTFMSPQWENILGYSMAELYQQRASIWINSIHIDDRQRVKQALEALFDDGRPYDVEFRAQRKNGEWFWAHDRAVATHDQNGIRVATGLLSDITERKKAEESLLRLASIVEFSEDAIIGKTTEGVITSWNRAAEKMYGYTKTEVLGRNLSFLVTPERREEIRALIERVRAGHSVECFETQRLTKEGSVLDVSLSVSPIRDASGQVTGSSAIARDLTPRKRDAEQLRLQAASLEAAANAIVITDYEGKIVWVNRAFTAMTGYSKEEVLGKDPRLLKSEEQPESYYAELWSTISSGKIWHSELVNRRKDGTTYTEEMTITPIAQNVGQANWSHFIAIKQDITERKRAEEELYRAHQMLQTVLNTIPQRVFWKDRNCTYVGCNRAFAKTSPSARSPRNGSNS
jgi:PAS domain S-box-containing protein